MLSAGNRQGKSSETKGCWSTMTSWFHTQSTRTKPLVTTGLLQREPRYWWYT